MANPQVEDGYTRIANELIEALIRSRLSGQELSLALLIIRKTYGYGQKEAVISYKEICEAMDVTKSQITRLSNKLFTKLVIGVHQLENGQSKVFKINKNYEEWQVRSKKSTVHHFVNGSVPQLENSHLYKRNKRNIYVMNVQLKDGSEYKIDDDFFALLKITYPDVSHTREVKKIIAWCSANPSKRKTRRGVKKFINGWFSRAQEKIDLSKPKNNDGRTYKKL